VFLPKDTLVVALQVLGLTEEIKQKAEVKFTFFRDDQVFKEYFRKAAEWRDLPNVFEEVPLTDFAPYHYGIQVALLIDGSEVVKAREEFDVTHREAVARPWVHSRVLPERDNPLFSYILGVELSNLGRMDEAQAYLERAYSQKRDSLETVTALAQLYLDKGEFSRVEPLLAPFLSQEKPAAYEIFYLSGRALQKAGESARAVEVLDKAVAHYGINANLLNILGECYRDLGKNDEALAAWTKSLELNPDQAEIKRNIEALKKKK
jgi:tetratricopeptide (TPR) repeat protein